MKVLQQAPRFALRIAKFHPRDGRRVARHLTGGPTAGAEPGGCQLVQVAAEFAWNLDYLALNYLLLPLRSLSVPRAGFGEIRNVSGSGDAMNSHGWQTSVISKLNASHYLESLRLTETQNPIHLEASGTCPAQFRPGRKRHYSTPKDKRHVRTE